MSVLVLDRRKQPLMPCTEKRARLLLERKRAVVHKLAPFTIRLKDRAGGDLQPVALKIDPGSKGTGMAIAREQRGVATALFLLELRHRGGAIRKSLEQRAGYRRRRRSANLRHRAPRFHNRRRADGWLAPSLRHRLDTVTSWVSRLRRLCPVSRIALELVRFDLQKQTQPEIAGIAYQQGELAGYEVREYLLEKWGRACAYCDKTETPLQVEHIVPRARGGTDRVSNLTLACSPCNRRKGVRTVESFLAKQPERLCRLRARAQAPLRDAAAVNATRWAVFGVMRKTGLPVETSSGGRTKWNRSRFHVPKTHAVDALCVGRVDALADWNKPTLLVQATGRGSYQRTRVTAAGFRRGILMRQKTAFGFRTGDLVRAHITKGKKVGTYTGRVAIRATGRFNVQTRAAVVQGISHRSCRSLQRADGYAYNTRARLLPAINDGVSAGGRSG